MFELVQALVLVVVATGLAVGGLLMQHGVSARRWRGLATTLGLEVEPHPLHAYPTLVGRWDGQEIRLSLAFRATTDAATMKLVSRAFTILEVPLSNDVAAGLRITHETLGTSAARLLGGQDVEIGDPLLDGRLRLQGEDEDLVRTVVQQPAVREALAVLMSEHRRSRVVDGRVVVESLGIDAVESMRVAEGAVRLARVLAAESRGPWARFCERRGLADSGQKGRMRLVGAVDGMPTEVRVGGSARAGSTVRIDVLSALPRGLRIEAAGQGERPGAVRLGDPVLDDLVAVSGFDADGVRELLRDDDLRGDLLAVVHQFPGSRVAQGAVWLHMPQTDPETVERGLDLALVLARRIDGLAGS